MIANLLIDLGPYIHTVTNILIHSLWQGILVGILAAAALYLLRGQNARIRYAVSCGAMAVIVGAAAVTAVSIWPDRYYQAGGASELTTEMADREGSPDVGAKTSIPSTVNDVASSSRWWKHPSVSQSFFMIWVAGVMLFSIYHFLGWRRARGFAGRDVSSAPVEWQARFDRLCDELRVKRIISLLSSSVVKVPCVVGWIKPVILVPASMFTSLDPSEVEMILVHELAHVRRYDVLVNILQTAVETLFFFNPAVWWLSRQLRIERENCCDDVAILKTGNRLKYARALSNLEESRMFRTSFGSALAGTPLRRRIQRIVGTERPRFYSSVMSLSGMLLIVLIIAVSVGLFGGMEDSVVQASTAIETAGEYDPEPGDLRGEWEIESSRDELQIHLYHEDGSQTGFRLDRDEVFEKIGDGRESFQVIRDAGTLFLNGELEWNGRNVWGEGEWYFQPDSDFVRFMSRYGLRRGNKQQALSLAIFDVTQKFISGLEDYGYLHLDVDNLISARIHGVTPELVKEFQDAGYRELSFDQLIAMQIHGVSPNMDEEFTELGLRDLSLDDMVAARIHGVTPELVKEFQDAGYRDLSFDSYVALRIFNLDVRDFKNCYRHRFMDFSEDNMVLVCGHDITLRDFEELQGLGFTDINGIIKMLARNVTPNYVRSMSDLGYDDLAPAILIQLRNRNVTPSFVRLLQREGLTDLTPEELISHKRLRE